MEKITIRAFRAVDDPGRSRAYAMEHAKVLADLGVDMVVVPDDSWSRDPDVFVFVAEHQELGMVAGIRLDRAREGQELRMEQSVKPLAPEIGAVLSALLPHGNAELCGLWNAHRFAGRGVPKLLIEAAIASAAQLKVRSVVTFIAEYVAPYAVLTGFTPMKEVGECGVLEYPIPSIRTHALILADVISMCEADAYTRQRMISLRIRPEQSRSECPKRTMLEVKYELMIDKAMRFGYADVMRIRERFAA